MKLLLVLLLSTPPSWIFGHYADGEDYFDISRGKKNTVHVLGEVHGPADSVCTFGGDGEWKKDALYVPYDDVGGQCTLVIRFKDGTLITDDPDLDCRRAALCGARVGLDGWELPKVTPPPKEIFGRYSKSEDACWYENADIKCGGKDVSFIEVNEDGDKRIHVTGELAFFNGHSCSIDGYGSWRDGVLHVPHEDECDLILHFKDGVISTEDPDGKCKWELCGLRGGFQGIALPKEKQAAANSQK